MAEQTERFERERGDFDTDLLLNEADQAHLALMERFDGFRPLDCSFFGGWEAEAAMLFALPSDETGASGHIGSQLDEDGD